MDAKRVVCFNVILLMFYVQYSLCINNDLNRNDFYHYFARNIIPNTDIGARIRTASKFDPKLNSLDESRVDSEKADGVSIGKRVPESELPVRPLDVDTIESMMAQIKEGEKRLAHFLHVSEPNNRKRETGDVYKNMFLGVRG